MANTTFEAIRINYAGSTKLRGLLEKLTPRSMANKGFVRLQDKNSLLRDWCGDKPTEIQFRKFEWKSTSDVTDYEVLSSPQLRTEYATLTVAYPVLSKLYGPDDLDSMESVIRADAVQLRDAILTPDNLIAGCEAAIPQIKALNRQGNVWFQEITVELIYYEDADMGSPFIQI
jgi:hypothetical protein